jgi:hypothetical protein
MWKRRIIDTSAGDGRVRDGLVDGDVQQRLGDFWALPEVRW